MLNPPCVICLYMKWATCTPDCKQKEASHETHTDLAAGSEESQDEMTTTALDDRVKLQHWILPHLVPESREAATQEPAMPQYWIP